MEKGIPMSDNNSGPTPGLNLEHLRERSKALLCQYRSGDADARARVHIYFKPETRIGLKRVQLVVARESGYSSWDALRAGLAIPEGFDDALIDALASDNANFVDTVFDALDLGAVSAPDVNRLLQLVAKYGYSGRTDRYAAVVARLLRHWEPDLGTCALLGLAKEASAHLQAGKEALSARNDDGATPLHLAAERGVLGLTESLIKAGADVNALDAHGQTPLDRAMHAGPLKPAPADDVVALLRRSGAAVDLGTLASLGDTPGCKALIEAGERVDSCDAHGRTALFRAVRNNRPDVVSALLDLGADPNAASLDGQTPLSTGCLHTLSQECDAAILDALIKSGAHLTPIAAVVTQALDALERFIDADPDLLEGEELLDYAIHAWRKDALRLLLKRGAKPSETNWGHIERIAADDAALGAELRGLADA